MIIKLEVINRVDRRINQMAKANHLMHLLGSIRKENFQLR